MMTPALQSYSQDHWQDGSGDAKPLLDAATGAEVACVPARGPDIAAMLAYARDTGGPALRALTFHERAEMLKALAKYLSGYLDEFAEMSLRTGATRRDTAIDVDGGIGTVAVYASKGARELPDATTLDDGDIEPLSRGGTFAGRHLYTSRLGAAVQINAFNFPVWGMLEKFAPAFLAGMPSVVKACKPDSVPNRTCGAPDRQVRAASGGSPVAIVRRARWAAGQPDSARHPRVYRLGRHRPGAARTPGGGGTVRRVHRRGRFAELFHPWRRRHSRRTRVRPVRRPARH